MGKLIEVKETIRDKYSLFNIKRFNLSGLSVERPIRALDAKNIRYEHIETFFNDYSIMFEKSLSVNMDRFYRIINSDYDRKIRNHFGFPGYAKKFPRYISVTFTFNPFSFLDKRKVAENYLEGYLLYCQTYSTSLLLVPNTKVYRMVNKAGGKRVKETIVTLDEFINLVDTMYSILEYRDNKPIFVPFSLKFSMLDIDKLAEHYMKKEYYNIWIDFEGSSITEDKIARIRKFIRKFDERGLFDRLVVIATNIRREIVSNVKTDYTPASDVLAPLIGANIVGVNREPMRPIEGRAITEKDKLLEHKARVFDPNTYYYIKATISQHLDPEIKSKILTSKGTNTAINTKLLDGEFERQSKVVLESRNIKEYISNKRMLHEYKHGTLLKALEYGNYIVRRKLLKEWF